MKRDRADDGLIDLVGEGIDVSFRMGELADSSMTAKKISETQRLVIGTPEYFSQYPEPKVPADLAEHKAVIYSRGVGAGRSWTFKKGAKEVSIVVDGRITVSAAEGVRAAVLAGLGLTIASKWMFSPELKSGAVKSVLDEWELPKLPLWAAFPSGRLVSSKARAFANFVQSILEPDAQ